jgi:hypothetical protein
MCGKGNMFGGSDSQENNIASSSQSFTNMLQGNYSSNYNRQSALLGQYAGDADQLIAGTLPNVQGFSAPTLAGLNTAAIDSAGAQARNVEQAVGTGIAGEGGGGGSGQTTGAQQQLKEAAASQAAGTLATNLSNINLNNYATGRSQQLAGISTLGNAAAQLSPTSYANPAISSGGNAFGEANQINTQNNQEAQAIGGTIESGIEAAAGGFGNLDMTGGSTFGEQVGNFFQGANG